nr:MAG TPA: hypothetical protein [Caudoviricetes sp.]
MMLRHGEQIILEFLFQGCQNILTMSNSSEICRDGDRLNNIRHMLIYMVTTMITNG